MNTPEQIKSAAAGYFKMLQALAEAIRELGEIPSGHLYAPLSGRVELGHYQQLIDTLKSAGLVSESPAHLLKWIGPKADIPIDSKQSIV